MADEQKKIYKPKSCFVCPAFNQKIQGCGCISKTKFKDRDGKIDNYLEHKYCPIDWDIEEKEKSNDKK